MVKNFKRTFRSYQGRNFFSRWGRKVFERTRVREFLGLNLAAAVFVVSLLEPQAEALVVKQKISHLSSADFSAIETKTETTLSWPVKNPRISQGYHWGHPGVDLVSLDEEGKKNQEAKISPVDKGVVAEIIYSRFAYGNHLIIEHPHGRRSLYGHLKEIKVAENEEVTRESILGEMGNSGWASGVHLHLELYQDGRRIDPLSILPKTEKGKLK